MPSVQYSKKRLVVACDGTWVNSDNGFVRDSWLPWNNKGHLANSSNVTRICRAILPRGEGDIPQVVYYQGGLGSQDNFWSWLVGGYLGEGISENIREAYAFLCSNYEDGDEIILIGFSRGAFTARSIGGLISSIGLLTKRGLSAFYPIFTDWEHQMDDKYKPTYGSSLWKVEGRPKFRDPAYLKRLEADSLTRPGIPIKAIAVWDTVGSLGVPDIKIFGFPVYKSSRAEYAFINTEVAPNVENAYQALALDERREPFAPTVWESPPEGTGAPGLKLRQCWFPGVHTSVGGGYQDTSISDITLAWMMTQLSPHLSFDKGYINLQRQQNQDFYAGKSYPKQFQTYSLGLIERSDTGLAAKITGTETRTPGTYHATDPKTGHQTSRTLKKTNEFFHPSIRFRLNNGPGLSSGTNLSSDPNVVTRDLGKYKPLALQPNKSTNTTWDYVGPNQDWGVTEFGFGDEARKWDSWGKWIYRKGNEIGYIIEDKIESGSVEMELLKGWGAEVADKVISQ